MRLSIVVEFNNRAREDSVLADMKDFAQQLAEQSRRKLESLAVSDKMQLHRRRILDAEIRPFWSAFTSELNSGIAEYDRNLTGTALEQGRDITKDETSIRVQWRYPNAQQIIIALDFERRLILLSKKNLGLPGEASRQFLIEVDNADRLLAVEVGRAIIGGPTELAQTVLRYIVAETL